MKDFDKQLKDDFLPWLAERHVGESEWEAVLTVANYYLPARKNADSAYRRMVFNWWATALGEFITLPEEPFAEFEFLMANYVRARSHKDNAGTITAGQDLADFVEEQLTLAKKEEAKQEMTRPMGVPSS